MYQISPVYARVVYREYRQAGHSDEVILAGTGLTGDRLQREDTISMTNFLTLLTNAAGLGGQEPLGLLIGRQSNLMTLGPLGAAMAVAPNVREGLQVVESFARLHTGYARVGLISHPRGIRIDISYLGDLGTTRRYHEETVAMLVQHYAETLCGQPLPDIRYQFTHPEPEYRARYADYLHGKLTFGAKVSSVEIFRPWLDQRSPYFSAAIWDQAQAMLAARIRELGRQEEDTYSRHVTALLRSSEPPLPDLQTMASRLHLSERTLNRRLREEGSSFRTIRGDVLAHWARQLLLSTDHSIEAISAQLGYQDTANFRRAFRKRENCSPRDFRQRSRDRPSS